MNLKKLNVGQNDPYIFYGIGKKCKKCHWSLKTKYIIINHNQITDTLPIVKISVIHNFVLYKQNYYK